MSECVYAGECANFNKSCRKCFGHNQYKSSKVTRGLRSRSYKQNEKKEGMNFENRGTKKYNNTIVSARDAARRQLASGALHYALGDMITEEALTAALAEFKERGTISASGEKQISIKKSWLDKLEEEARAMNREFYFLPFTFKGSNTDYVAMTYDRLMAYVQTIQSMHETIRLLQMQLEGGEADGLD